MHKKLNLDKKLCVSCKRPFSWRKKWELNWEDVKYCSKRCRGQKVGSKTASPKHNSLSH